MREGVVLFSTPMCDEAVPEALAYIKRHNLNSEDVRVLKTGDGMCSVVCKREVTLSE